MGFSLLLAIMLIAGLIFTGQGLALETLAQPDLNSSSAVQSISSQVYGAALNVDEIPAQADQNVDSQLYSTRPDQIILTWTADPQTTQTVSWRVYGVAGSKIQYLPQSGSTDDFSSAQEKDIAGSQLYGGFNHFVAELDNLQPGTTYVYRVGKDSGWSEPATFTTAAATNNFSFMFMGDVHSGYYDTSAGIWQQLLAQACSAYPDIKFALQAGDIVDNSEDTGDWSQLFTAAAGVFDHIPLMPAEGNHDSGDADLFNKYFALPQNGPVGYEGHNYSFDYGNAHFVVLDSSLMGCDGDAYQAGITWLENDLQQSNKKWKFVMFHVPAYTINIGDNDAAASDIIRQYWVPVLERNGVDMVFVGHQHMYMRTYPIYQGQVQDRPTGGITYLMGNAGNKFYINPKQHDYVAKVLSNVTCYTYIKIEGDVLTMITRDVDGNVLDEYKVDKGSSMDASVSVSGVKLLNSSYQEITSVPVQGAFRLQVHLNNNTGKQQTTVAVLQVRGSDGAAANCGGKPLGIASLKTDVPVVGVDIYADFNLSGLPAGKAYVDVYVFDESNVPIDIPYQKFSFDITS